MPPEHNPETPPELHLLRRKVETPQELITETDIRGKPRDALTPSDIGEATYLMENALRKLAAVQDEKLQKKSTEPYKEMIKLFDKYGSELVMTDAIQMYRDPKKVEAEMTRIIKDFLQNTTPEIFQKYDQLKTPEEKKAFVRQNMDTHPEMKDIYFADELLRDFGKDIEFACFVIDRMDVSQIDLSAALMIVKELSSRLPEEVVSRYVDRVPSVKPFWEFLQKNRQMREKFEAYEIRLYERWKENPAGFDAITEKIGKLKEESQPLFLKVLSGARLLDAEYKVMFKAQADIDLFFEIVSFNKDSFLAIYAFNMLYEYGPDPAGTRDQTEAAKKIPTQMLTQMLAISEQALNCSHRELTATLAERPPEEIFKALEDLKPCTRTCFFLEMINRNRLTNLAAALPTPELRVKLANQAMESVLEPDYILLLPASPGLEGTIQDRDIGQIFFKGLIVKLENLGGQRASELKDFLLAKFEAQAKEYGIPYDAVHIAEVKEKMGKASQYDSREALKDKTYKVVTLFTTDSKINQNQQKDFWMQNSDFLRTYQIFAQEGYQLQETIDRNGKKAKNTINTPQEADRLVSLTLVKTVSGVQIVQQLIKTDSNYQSAKNVFEDASVDMIVQRGHCWDTEESFKGFAVKKKGGTVKPHRASHQKMIIIGGCFQARNLQEFEEHVEGPRPLFVATSKTGKGQITIPLTTLYAEELVRAGLKSGIVDMHAVDSSVKRRLERLLHTVPEADGYIFTTDISQIIRKTAA